MRGILLVIDSLKCADGIYRSEKDTFARYRLICATFTLFHLMGQVTEQFFSVLFQAFIQALAAMEARSKVRGENSDNFLLDLYAVPTWQGGYREAGQVKD